MGLFSFQNFLEYGGAGAEHICMSYNKEQIKAYMGSAFRWSRMFAVLSHFTLFVATLLVTIGSCAFVHINIWKTTGILFLVGSLCEVLIFVVYSSDSLTGDLHQGRFFWGSALLIVSILFTIAAGVMTLRIPPFDPENIPESALDALREQPMVQQILPEAAKEKKPYKMPPGVETVTETILPDGSRKYTTTKWNKDGTTTVTEEIRNE